MWTSKKMWTVEEMCNNRKKLHLVKYKPLKLLLDHVLQCKTPGKRFNQFPFVMLLSCERETF